MNEYQDQDVWFELWGYDGFTWQFLADFDTRAAAHAFKADPMSAAADYEESRIRRVAGVTA